MFTAEEFMYGASTTPAAASAGLRWPRQAAPWFIVTLVHGAVFALVLSISPQARQVFDQVIQASLVLPQPLPVAPPEPSKPPALKPQPKARHAPPPRPTPVLAAAVHPNTAPASFVAAPAPVAPVPAASVNPGPAVAAPVAAPAPLAPLIPPVFNANYLENPAPIYPSASRRLAEKGRVVLRVYVSALGRAERVDIRTSSGFERLDRAALDAVGSWRFVPARRGEEAVAAWVLVPISFTL